MAKPEWRNPKYNERGTIDVELNHPLFGWIPFTAEPSDVEAIGKEIHADVVGSKQKIAAYIPPEVVPPQPEKDDPVVLVMLDQVNQLRAQASLPEMTMEQFKAKVREKANTAV